jgi:hypothetical protein
VLPTEKSCKGDQFKDCLGNCQDGDYKDWIGDGSCDDGKQGFSFNCRAFECDGGDCVGEHACEMKDPGEICPLGRVYECRISALFLSYFFFFLFLLIAAPFCVSLIMYGHLFCVLF